MNKPISCTVNSQRETGIALVMSLILLAVITLISTSSMNAAINKERVAASQKQVTDALMAAEIGLAAAVETFYDDGFVWNNNSGERVFNAQYTIENIMGSSEFVSMSAHNRPDLEWQIEHIEHQFIIAGVEQLTVRSVGKRSGSIAERRVEFDIIVPNTLFIDPPAPLTLAGYVHSFAAGGSAQFKVIGEVADADLTLPGTPAIVVNDTDATTLTTVTTAIQNAPDRTSNYTGASGKSGITSAVIEQTLGDFWGDANALRNFVEMAKLFGTTYPNDTVFDSNDGFNIGHYTDSNHNEWVISLVEGNATITGNRSGAGVLLVTGKLTWAGTAEFSGLVMVLGGQVDWQVDWQDGGNKGIQGAMYIAHITQDENGNWVFGHETTEGIEFAGGGNSTLKFDRDILRQVAESASPRVVNWREVQRP